MTTPTRIRLTPRQERLLVAIARYWDDSGFAPSYSDLMALGDISARSVVGYLVKDLSLFGLLTHQPGIGRSIVLTELGRAVLEEMATA